MFLKCLPILDDRFLHCSVWWFEDPELIHEIFSHFNETNNKFHEVEIYTAAGINFFFDEFTTGKLK